MGIFQAIKNITNEANEQAHGVRLLNQVQSTFTTMESWDERVQLAAMMGFLQIQQRIISECVNMSSDGRIRIAMEMQKQASKTFDFDMAGSCAKWLAGAWLESNQRNSEQAKLAHQLLDQFAEYARDTFEVQDNLKQAKQIEQQIRNTAPNSEENLYFSFEEWYRAFKLAAARSNPELAINQNGGSLIDYMDHEPLKRAYNDNVSPEELGRDFANQFDASTF